MAPTPSPRTVRRRGLAALLLPLLLWVGPHLRILDPPPTTFLVDRAGRPIGVRPDAPDAGLGYWPVDPVPPRIAAATLALEDRRFYLHPGVDPLAIGRALRGNLQAGARTSGASTLAMQLARLQDPGPRTYIAKSREALTAIGLTLLYGRAAILGAYLRQAPYGNNLHGVAFAARIYFGKPVDDLSWAEVAFLTALPQAPSLTNPYTAAGRARATQRAARILAALRDQGQLSATEAAAAQAELGRLPLQDRPRRDPALLHALVDAPAGQGLVRSSLDRDLQDEVARRSRAAVAGWATRGAGNASVLIVDRATGQLRVALGSVNYFDRAEAGAIDYSRLRRNPGSTLKPFVYAAALDQGTLRPNTVLADLRVGPEGIANADGRFLGPLLPRQALANSRNIPALAVAQGLGLPRLLGLFDRLGLNPTHQGLSTVGAGLALGGLPVSLRALVSAWMTLAGDGRLRPLVDRLDEESVPGERIFSPRAVAQIARWLSDPLARLPTFPRMGATEFPFPVAIKTGTSGDFRDAWALAFTDTELIGVWVGNAAWRPMSALSGYNAAAQLLHTIATLLHPADGQGLRDHRFAAPTGTLPVALCPLSGQRAGLHCDRRIVEDLLPREVPAEACTVHRQIFVDPATGAPATPATRAPQARVIVDLPPAYAAWARQQGLAGPPLAGPLATAPRLKLLSPVAGAHVMADPEAAPGTATLELAASADPPVPTLLWIVDDEPYAEVPAPYSLRWPITPGRHTFAVQLPGAPITSPTVEIVGER